MKETVLLTALQGKLLCLHHALGNGYATQESDVKKSSILTSTIYRESTAEYHLETLLQRLKQYFFQGPSSETAEITSYLTVTDLNTE